MNEWYSEQEDGNLSRVSKNEYLIEDILKIVSVYLEYNYDIGIRKSAIKRIRNISSNYLNQLNIDICFKLINQILMDINNFIFTKK